MLFVARGDTAAMFDPVEEPLDPIAISLEQSTALKQARQRRVTLDGIFGAAPAASMLRRSQAAS